jgi:hypothetical protein
MGSPAKPAWAVEPAGHVEALLVLGQAPGEQRFRLDLPGKAAYRLGRLAEACDIHVQAREPTGASAHVCAGLIACGAFSCAASCACPAGVLFLLNSHAGLAEPRGVPAARHHRTPQGGRAVHRRP